MRKLNRVGEKYINTQGLELEIIEYIGAFNCTIKFNDKRGTVLYNIIFQNIKKGNVQNPYYASIHNIGFLGEGKYNSFLNVKIYSLWANMICRCYNEIKRDKYIAYKDVTVCEEWHNFQNFAEWYEQNYIQSFVLDKDILIKGNKIYSPETCCFIPHEINTLLITQQDKRGDCPIGVCKHGKKFSARLMKNGKREQLGRFDTPEEAFQAYKTAKEAYIKEVADKWRGQITEQVYQALINYKVEIDD